MAKKAPAVPAKKAPAKRKPRPKKPAVPIVDPTDYGTPVIFPSWLTGGIKAIVLLTIGVIAGIYAAGGIPIGGDVRPGPGDCLSQAHAADRVTQIAVLKDLAAQPFDGATNEGRKQAGEFFNAQRFRNRPSDFAAYTDAVAEAIAGNAEAELVKKLEGK